MSKQIKQLLTDIIPEHHRWKLELFRQWNSIIGPAMQKRVTLSKIDHDVLHIGVSHPAWAQELLLLTPILKEKINACFDEPKIKNIRFHYTNANKPSLPTTRQSSRKTKEALQPIALNSQEQSLLEPFVDDALQLSVAAYLQRCKALKKEKL